MAIKNNELNREMGEIKQLIKDSNKNNEEDNKETNEQLDKLNGQVAVNTKKVWIHDFVLKTSGTLITSGLFVYGLSFIISKFFTN